MGIFPAIRVASEIHPEAKPDEIPEDASLMTMPIKTSRMKIETSYTLETEMCVTYLILLVDAWILKEAREIKIASHLG